MPNLRTWWAVVLWLSAVSRLYAAPCNNSVGAYQGYRIQTIRVTSPVGFFAAAKFGLNHLADSLPLQRNGSFDAAKYSQSAGDITSAIRTGFSDGFASMRFVATVGELENCNTTTNTLDVHYVVYTTTFPPLLGRSFEQHQAETGRPATTGASLGAAGRFLVVPNFGYDRTRRGYGGVLFRSAAPIRAWDEVEADVSASSNSLLSNLSLVGKRTPAARYLNEAQWRVDSIYHDVPAGPEQLKEGKLSISFFGSSKELAESGLVLRYGLSIAGGHQQSALRDIPNSSYGDLKFLVDATGRWGPAALMGAYGIQVGSTLGERNVDFVKHVIDAGYSVTLTPLPKFITHRENKDDDRPGFIGRPHHPFSIESRLTAGFIQDFGRVPAAERFYGGNQSAPFIQGQPWDVHGQAYIRSIPENRLGSPLLGTGSGGTRFYSLNLTVARALFGRAILPEELGTGEFVHNLDFAINTAKGELADTYLGKAPVVIAAASSLDAIQNEIGNLKKELDALSLNTATTVRAAPILKVINSGIGRAFRTVEALRQGGANTASILFNTILPRLEQNLSQLQNVLSASDHAAADGMGDRRTALETARIAFQNNLSGPNIEAARKSADLRAEKDLSVAERVLNTFLYQLNAYSISPVGIFDAARVWPGVGTRYAAGGGVRLSLVNVNFTLGYAANPSRRPGEGPGALFFKLDVSDLFH